MVNKFLMKSILAVSLVVFMGTPSWAEVDGTSTTQTSCTSRQIRLGLCSLKVEGLLKRLGNVTNNPTAFAATILIQAGTVVFRNPAIKSGEAEGVPFVTEGFTLEGVVPLDANQVSRNGRALADIVFHDPELIAAVIAGLTAKCGAEPPDLDACASLAAIQRQVDQHPNWAQTVVVTELQVLGQQFTDADTTSDACNLADRDPDPDIVQVIIDAACYPPTDALGTQCTAPPEVVADAVTYTWKAFTYACTEICHDLDNNLPDCNLGFPLL